MSCITVLHGIRPCLFPSFEVPPSTVTKSLGALAAFIQPLLYLLAGEGGWGRGQRLGLEPAASALTVRNAEGIGIVRRIRERIALVTLSEQEYVSAVELASSGTIVGAVAYDALIGHCALKAGAKILLTWNVRDFTRLGSAVAQLVKTPLGL